MRSNLVRCLTLLALALPVPLWAASPSSGTLTDTSGPVAYSAGPFFVANPTPVPLVDSGPECFNPGQPCDDFALTVSLPASYLAEHPNAFVEISLAWTDGGAGSSDYDLYIYRGTVINTDGGQAADYQSAGQANPEVATVGPLSAGGATYTVKVVPYTPSGETVHVTMELKPGLPAVPDDGFGGPDPTVPGVPRYQNFLPPEGSSAESSDGEFNIGFNPHSGRIMVMNIGPVWRLTPAEVDDPAMPESCPALWEDKSTLTTNIGLDPILFTDQKSGRTFASNSTVGANAVYAYSDDDGDLWVEIGAGPPNGGADHQTIGTGPLPADQAALTTPLNQGQNAIFCSQDVVGPAMCQRSLDLGMSWGPGVPAYTGSGPEGCGGLHGHVHIAPNGTAWLPVNQCNGRQGGATSTDGGLTWTEFAVTGSKSQINGADPSIALDADSTAYYCYVNDEPVADGNPPEGHVHVKVSTDGGATWIRDFDLGASHGIKNAVHTEAIGGSSGRAACGFLGTNVAGDYQALHFPGNWYAFVATTYDGGLTWTTVNATPNDTVQRASGIWQQGGSHTQRNLLDFNEITVDAEGRVLYGYSDGCESAGCVAGTAANDFVAHMRVARQLGGRGLFASKDTAEPAAPSRACLAGTRDPAASQLSWVAPNNGGAPVTGYQVFRGTAAGNEVLLAETTGTGTTYDDTTADPAVPTYSYFVKAVNAAGTGAASNRVTLTVVVPPPSENVCDKPGLTKLSDASGDTSAVLGIVTTPAPPGSDLRSFQLAQPYDASASPVVKLAFTLNTDNGQSPQPAGTAWYVAMKIADPAPATTFRYRGVHMAWNGTTPVFESYTPSPNSGGGVDGRFVTAGSQKPADPSSTYAAPFNKVVIVVKASDLGLAPGDTIAGFVSGVSQTAGGTITALYDQMPDSLTFSGSYTVRDNRLCAPQHPPVASLQAIPNVGCAPLTVSFDGSQSFDPDGDAITTYTFDFGDGSAPRTQGSPTTSNTYTAAGSYAASLRVVDDRGGTSTNSAQAQVSVAATPATPAIAAPTKVKPNQAGLIASVANHAGSQYAWSIQNGRITAGQGTSQITFTSGSKGDLTLSVNEVTSQGCLSATGKATVIVTNKK
jgi:hypothetical protein